MELKLGDHLSYSATSYSIDDYNDDSSFTRLALNFIGRSGEVAESFLSKKEGKFWHGKEFFSS